LGPSPAGAPPAPAVAEARITAGFCFVSFAYDIGLAVDLEHAARLVTETKEREAIRHKRRTPKYFEYRPAPLRVIQTGDPVTIGGFTTTPRVEAVVWDFGGASVSYVIPISGPISGLLGLSDALYENRTLLEDSRRRVARLLETVRPAVDKPQIAEPVEDYSIYQIESAVVGEATPAPSELIATHRQLLAQVLRSETQVLSKQEVDDALASRIAYGPMEEVIIDWNAAVVFSREAEDVRAVLEYANMELLELRLLDDQLDDGLAVAHQEMSDQTWRSTFRLVPGPRVRRIAELQMDAALLFEGVNNALKLIGDQYLARVYRLAADRFRLPDWDASIIRKLETVDSIYQKLHDRQSTTRLEALEWIIIILIALSIVLMFV
jgi:hypothetical protein